MITYCMVSFICKLQNQQIHQDRKQVSDRLQGDKGMTANGYGISLEGDVMFWN